MCCIAIAAFAMLSLAANVSAQYLPAAATTAPAAAPATQPTQTAAQLQKWFDNLASSEPTVRDQARSDLLGLNRPDLNTLREVVRKNLPLMPSQSAVLHDIVMHVYLAGGKEEGNPHGFLGVMLDPTEDGVQRNMQASGAGVYIFDCMLGYCGYRYLRPGDVISGVVIAGEVIRVSRKDQLIAFISNALPGSPVQLQVLRQGRVMGVTLKVDPKPSVADEGPFKVNEWKNERLQDAEDYWTKTFVPILDTMTDAGPSSNTRPEA
jgi:hypothetical protein